MYKYVLSFAKHGYIKYTSHLDMQRLFKRAFRRCGVDLAYSQGFNPHPKMGFAQSLSLGYEALAELLEFETGEPVSKRKIIDVLPENLPRGIEITGFGNILEKKKTIAAAIIAAEYEVTLPIVKTTGLEEILKEYLNRDKIKALKRQKKSKELKEVDIRNKIQQIDLKKMENGGTKLIMLLDCGSKSNLSAELVIETFLKFADLKIKRYEVEVCRNKLILPVDYEVKWM